MHKKNYLATYAKSFNWAGFFLPREVYQKCSALYSFCRILDNIADDENKIDLKQKEFLKFRENFKKKNLDIPVIKDMWKLISEYNISVKIVDDLFEGIKSDIKNHVKLNSKKDLLIYSYQVAGTVGLMMAKILKVNDKDSLKSAINLGIAMQLTNISRDVIEDSKINRFYINKNFEDIKSTIALADIFYDKSFYSIKNIPLNLRFSILVARRIYRKIGYKILKKQNYENYENSGKIYVNKFEKILETFLSIFDLFFLNFMRNKKKQDHGVKSLIEEEIDLNERFWY